MLTTLDPLAPRNLETYSLLFKIQTDRAMVRAEDMIEDARPLDPFFTGRIHTEIINPPADIPGPGIDAVTPPGVVVRLLVEFPEGINIAGFYKGVHPSPFRG